MHAHLLLGQRSEQQHIPQPFWRNNSCFSFLTTPCGKSVRDKAIPFHHVPARYKQHSNSKIMRLEAIVVDWTLEITAGSPGLSFSVAHTSFGVVNGQSG